jgi:hypothetical protein
VRLCATQAVAFQLKLIEAEIEILDDDLLLDCPLLRNVKHPPFFHAHQGITIILHHYSER